MFTQLYLKNIQNWCKLIKQFKHSTHKIFLKFYEKNCFKIIDDYKIQMQANNI